MNAIESGFDVAALPTLQFGFRVGPLHALQVEDGKLTQNFMQNVPIMLEKITTNQDTRIKLKAAYGDPEPRGVWTHRTELEEGNQSAIIHLEFTPA